MRNLILALLLTSCAASAPRELDVVRLGPVDPYLGAVLLELAGELPVDKPIRLIQTPFLLVSGGLYGRTRDAGPEYVIEVDAYLPMDMAAMVLVHEYAHVLQDMRGGTVEDSHGALWGIAYSEVYRAWME